MFDTLLHAPWVVQLCAAALIVLLLLFAGHFIPRAVGRWFTLGKIIKGLDAFKGRPTEKPTELFAGHRDLSHLWAEFSKTLFAQKRFDPSVGAEILEAYRLTIPAEQFFSSSIVVDSRVGAEFFKHVPGILTGIGIIGTFFGMLRGLKNFAISDNAQVVRESLGLLLHSVSEAFVVSAFAIFFAIAITFVEKITLAVLYSRAEELIFRLDSLYKAGAGEEMLAKLVTSSEDAVTTSKVLKDALVTELSGILRELADSQIAAQKESSERLGSQIGAQIGQEIATGLAEPIKAMTDALQGVSGDRAEGVHKLLTDVISGLSQNLKDLFGDQISGINEMQQQTISALQSAVGKMADMTASLEGAGTRGAEKMADKLSEAISSMEARQEVMTGQMARVVEDMKASVATSQSETNDKLAEALANVGQTVEALAGKLSEQSTQAAHAHAERQQRLASQSDASIASMQGAVESFAGQVERLIAEVKATVDTMKNVTLDTVSRMNTGAETMYMAASEFKNAGSAVTGVLRDTGSTIEKLAGAATSVGSASMALQGVVNDYRTSRDQMATMLTELNQVVANAKREATLTSGIIAGIERAALSLGTANIEAKAFTDGVVNVLSTSSKAFQATVDNDMDVIYRELAGKMATATGMLRQSIHELSQAVELSVPNRAVRA
ncbi:anti-phage ZorAB system protein ZorA [Paraburkholderia sediminicola]|uniref:anti-phage ZorAB system protein ZorA n=1 Tax=Paraburkholderia TaxID=1822464 RepID=UPI001558D138|nr:anti-phage ZorAB system protein ZorA [Paraburkholderia madseniana]NPT67407.1 anti-phage defense ZorAB system ZorA [Paraburkholderia madseniana]